MKKIFVLMLSLVMGVSVAACGNSGKKPSTTTPVTSEDTKKDPETDTVADGELDFSEKVDINITAWYPKTLNDDDQIIAFLEDKFNVKIKYELLPDAEYDNSISMRVAADDIPTYMRLKQAPVYSGLQEDGYIANISEYADKYGFENLKQYLSDPALDIDKEADGFYKIPGKIGPALHGMYIRKDWLDELGLEIPKDYDELYTVLTAFKENQLDGQEVSPLTMNGLFFLRRSSVAFTGVNEWGKVNGEWTSEQMVPEYKDFLKTMKKYYAEGLLDREVFTLNRSQAFEKIALGKAGMTYSNDGFFHDLQKQLTDVNPDGQLTPIVPWMAGPKGSLRPMGTGYYGYGVLSEKAPEETKVRMLAILDYLMTDEGSELLWDGIEGVHYEVVDGKKVFDQEARDRDFLSVQHHRFAQFVDYSFGYTLLEDEGLIANAADALKEENSVIDYTANFTSPEAQQIRPIIDDIANRWAVNFITGDADIDADWDKYQAEMEKAGYNTYIDELTQYMESIGR